MARSCVKRQQKGSIYWELAKSDWRPGNSKAIKLKHAPSERYWQRFTGWLEGGRCQVPCARCQGHPKKTVGTLEFELGESGGYSRCSHEDEDEDELQVVQTEYERGCKLVDDAQIGFCGRCRTYASYLVDRHGRAKVKQVTKSYEYSSSYQVFSLHLLRLKQFSTY